MKASELNRVLKGLSTGNHLREKIKEEVFAYKKLLKKRGTTIPLLLEEDEEILISLRAIEILLQETLAGRLSNVDLAYICDCLTLGEKVDFEDEKAQEIVFEIADPEINGGFTSDTELQQLIAKCMERS